MSEEQDVIDSLGEAGVLGGIRWAYLSATDRVQADYSEAAGHDATWVGITRFTLFRDRLDRVFACGRYAVPLESDAGVSQDLVHSELTERDIATLPPLPAELVERDDLNGSPGWAWRDWRWLLASSPFGKLAHIPWPQKSPTKQKVALQYNPDPAQRSLFDGFVDEELGGLEALLVATHQLDRKTLVVGHTQDVDGHRRELLLGRAKLNPGGGKAWHWSCDLLTVPPVDGGRRIESTPAPVGPDTVQDAEVRLRRPAAEQPSDQASGDQ